MKNSLIGACLLAVSAMAAADGVPLITPGKPFTSAEQSRLKATRPTLGAMPVVVNKNALDTTIITVDIEGKQYRFVGKQIPIPEEPGSVLWVGKAPEGEARLARSHLGLVGSIDIGQRMFRLTLDDGKPLLIEVPRSATPLDGGPTPQMIENARKRGAK